jgi:hypothetical protein
MNLFDRLSALLCFAPCDDEPSREQTIDHAVAALEERLAEARCCAALAIAAECRILRELDRLRATEGKAWPDPPRQELEIQFAVIRLAVDEVRRSLRCLEDRVRVARGRQLSLQAQQLASLVRHELSGPAPDTLRAEFDQLEADIRRLEAGAEQELQALPRSGP